MNSASRPRGRRRLAGLVVDHPQLAGGGDVDAVDEAAQQRSVGQFDLHALFAAVRVEPRRVFEPVVAGQQRAGFLEQLGAQPGIQLGGQRGLLGDHPVPRGLHERARGVRAALRRRQTVELLERGMYQ